MDWLIWILIIGAVLGVMSFAYRGEPERIRARTRRHVATGGSPLDAPDIHPRHQGGSFSI